MFGTENLHRLPHALIVGFDYDCVAARFMNGHDCFFKLCDSHDWATGACAVEWENEAERNEKYGAGVMRCTAAVGGLGVELILVLIAVGALYVAGGILVGRYRGDTGARASAGSG